MKDLRPKKETTTIGKRCHASMEKRHKKRREGTKEKKE
jgi:hypothetical protein